LAKPKLANQVCSADSAGIDNLKLETRNSKRLSLHIPQEIGPIMKFIGRQESI
jgi:hypothetical protein